MKKRFKVKRTYLISDTSTLDLAKVEDMLAKMIAQAFVKDHPELFCVDEVGNVPIKKAS
jgi:hypothetical protein